MADSTFWSYLKPFIIGSASGSFASAIIQPIDTIKVVIQAKRQAAGKAVVNLSPFVVGREVVTNNGVGGLYKGLDAAILRQVVYCGLRLGIYKYFEDKVKAAENRNLTFVQKLQYSLISGALGSVVANPTDVSLIRFQSDNNLPHAERRNYKNVFDAMTRIFREEGVRGLWTGAVPTIYRAMVVNSSQLIAYNTSKEQMQNILNEKRDTISIRLASSAISGIAVSCIALPFDNVKTKLMKMKPNAEGIFPYKGFFNCFAKSIKNEGVIGLWVGLSTFYTRTAPHAMIIVLLQDYLHDLLTPKSVA